VTRAIPCVGGYKEFAPEKDSTQTRVSTGAQFFTPAYHIRSIINRSTRPDPHLPGAGEPGSWADKIIQGYLKKIEPIMKHIKPIIIILTLLHLTSCESRYYTRAEPNKVFKNTYEILNYIPTNDDNWNFAFDLYNQSDIQKSKTITVFIQPAKDLDINGNHGTALTGWFELGSGHGGNPGPSGYGGAGWIIPHGDYRVTFQEVIGSAILLSKANITISSTKAASIFAEFNFKSNQKSIIEPGHPNIKLTVTQYTIRPNGNKVKIFN
jgi:hypothetical protein